MRSAAPPLEETFERLRALDADLCRATVGTPSGDGWLLLGELSDGDLERLFAAAQRAGTARPDYLGASIASALVDALVGTALPALLVEHRLPDVSPGNLAARLHGDAVWFDAVVLGEPRCHALATDADAGHPSVVVAGGADELHRRLAVVLVDAATPWFAAIRRRAPFGQRGMWGQLADDVCGTALWAARAAGLDQRAAWDEAQAIVDLIAGAVPELRVRPRLFPVRWSGGETLWQVKGTCCLWYTTFADPDPSGDGYCATCPLRPDDVRHERLRDWLEQHRTAAAG